MATLKDMKSKFRKPAATPKNARKPVGTSRLVDRVRAERRAADSASSGGKMVKETPDDETPIKRKFARPGGKYSSTTTDGFRDAVILFGKYKDAKKKVSELASEDRGYLMWICTKHRDEQAKGEPGFRPELIEVIKEWLDRAGESK